MTDTFEVRRRGVASDFTFVVVAEERDYCNERNVLRNIILKDELPHFGTPDRGHWVAQGIANVMERHVFLYSEHSLGSSCGPVFPIDDGEYEYPDEGDYTKYVEDMQKEGRWQGAKRHEKYPWKGVSDVLP